MPNNQSLGTMTIALELNGATYTQAITDAQRQLDRMAGKATAAGHSTVSSMQAASGAIRELNGDFAHNIRAVERLITTIPGVGNALKVAFPVIGGLAVAGMFAEMGQKVAAFIKQVSEMPNKVRMGFDSLHLAAALSTDQLRLTNAELENVTAKLNGKAQNNLAIELNEARVKADELAQSLEEDANKVHALLEAQKTSSWAKLLGTAGTASITGSVNSYNNQITDLGNQYAAAIRGGDKAGAAQKLAELKAKRDSAIDFAKQQLFVRDNPQYQGEKDQDMAGNQAGNRAILLGFMQTIRDSQEKQAVRATNADDVVANKKAQANKTAIEEAKRAAQQRFQAMVEDLNQQKLVNDLSIKQVFEYWESMKAVFSRGSAEYREIIAKQAVLASEGAKAAHESIAKFNREAKANTGQGESGGEVIGRANEAFRREALKDAGERNQGYLDANMLDNVNAYNTAREKEAAIVDEAGRSMTRYAAAVQMAAIHAQEFQTVMQGLQAILHVREGQNAIDPSKENQRALAEAQANIAKASTGRSIQAQADADNIYGRQTSAVVGATDALDDFIRATRDSATQARNFTTSSISGLNEQLLRGASGQRTSFGSYGAGLARDIGGMAMQKGEGALLSMFGLGNKTKPTGEKGNPLWVAMAQMSSTSSGLGITPTSFSSLLPGGSSGGSSSDPLIGLAMKALPFLPGFADGGSIGPNTWAMVGERGPEPFYSGSGGTILPNASLKNGSSGDTHIWNIDASNSTDPAQVRAQIMSAAPHIAAAAVKAVHENSRRGSGRTR